jgi:NADPH:quinone reductase-like Zn-dependent oxidoreductase
MRRVIFEEKGGPEVLKFETLDLPSPATGEVRIKIKAIGLNRYESMFRQGVYVVPPELPSAIGAEAVGIVEALGGDVSGFSVGDRVTAVPFTTIAGTGVYADTANVPTTTLLRSLDGTTDAEEAITWMAYLNAYNLLTAPRVEPGTTVLTIGATSGVGLATIQIAPRFGGYRYRDYPRRAQRRHRQLSHGSTERLIAVGAPVKAMIGYSGSNAQWLAKERHYRPSAPWPSTAAARKELGHLNFEPVPVISKAQIIAPAVGDA